MIQIKFHIQSNNFTKTKKIQFCKNSEKNLDTLYGIAKETIERKEKSDLEQLMMVCCFHMVKEIRENTIVGGIQDKLLEEWSKHQSTVQILKEIRNISIEAKIDNIPKKSLDFSFKHKDFVPNLTELSALR
ncbi:hypothetical protein [Nitrosopumilus ureiphilus]|nr:hypothetical protein [Nitrosopumilus ureiphilus]